MSDSGPVLTSRSGKVAGARRLLQRKFRREDGRFLVDGPQAVLEALEAGLVEEAFLDAESATEPARNAAATVGASGVPVYPVESQALKQLSGAVTPQGVVAVARIAQPGIDAVLARNPRLIVLLDGVADPGNAGTVIRVADAAGADAVVVSRASVDIFNDKCVRATTGSLFHLPVIAEADLVDVIGALRASGVQVLGTTGTSAHDLDSMIDAGDLSTPTAWVLGNEAHGLSSPVARACDRLVRIPIHGRAESLNLATAAAVVLYTSAREQRQL